MTDFGPDNVLFIGRGASIVTWYRCAVPADALGCPWIGIEGEPLSPTVSTGNIGTLPAFSDIAVVVVQQALGDGWRDFILDLKTNGTKVLYETDDFLHAKEGIDDHESFPFWNDARLEAVDRCAKACDALIVSTPSLAKIYGERYHMPVHVCRNGLDLGRYDLSPRTNRERTVIGWAGGVGHEQAFLSWKPAVEKVMDKDENTGFVAVGAYWHAQKIAKRFTGRVLGVPSRTVEQFPGALMNIDVTIGPVREDSDFFKHKSDLRFLEFGALGIPGVWHPMVYGDVVDHGVNGFLASTPEEASEYLGQLCADKELMNQMGEAARDYTWAERSSFAVANDWVAAFEAVT